MKVISRACWAAAASPWGSVSTEVAGAERPAAPAAELAELSLEQLMKIRIEKGFSASKDEQKVTVGGTGSKGTDGYPGAEDHVQDVLPQEASVCD